MVCVIFFLFLPSLALIGLSSFSSLIAKDMLPLIFNFADTGAISLGEMRLESVRPSARVPSKAEEVDCVAARGESTGGCLGHCGSVLLQGGLFPLLQLLHDLF